MTGEWESNTFRYLLEEPVRNGIYKQKEFHGRGAKIVNMGELFAHPRLRAVPMKRVEISSSETERFTLKKGDLLFARRSLVPEGAGKCSIVLDVDEPTTFESSIIRARPNRAKADSLFLYYFFNSSTGLHCLDTIRRQVAVAGITGSDLSRLEILMPPVAEQRAIAHILGTLDDKIELNRRMNETLEAIGRALFKSWFVDFDPVRAKAEGRYPSLPKPLADLFPLRFVDSDIGEIPDGWNARLLGDLLTESDERIGNTEAPEYSSTNEGLRPRSDRFTKKLARSNAKNKVVRNGYLVFGLSRRVLNFGLMRDEIGSVSAAYRVFTIDKSMIEPDLLERIMRLKSNYFFNAVSASSREDAGGRRHAADGRRHLRHAHGLCL